VSENQALRSVVLAIADDELVLGHRHSEWTGWAPHLEEDVAFSSIAQDEIGHAAALYRLAAETNGGDADALALGREADGYRNAFICERPNREWAYTLARHWFYDTADDLRLEALERSSSSDLAALAHKMRREERYHLMHADMWIKRIANGPIEGRNKLVHALTDAFADSLGIFEPYELEDQALQTDILTVASEELQQRFIERAGTALDELGMPNNITTTVPEQDAEFVASSSGDLIATGPSRSQGDRSRTDGFGGRRGTHTNDFKELWDAMTKTYRENPGARW
jgi:ring-1,2-phenylacetyl-CoA epoxidase subunit PaaC